MPTRTEPPQGLHRPGRLLVTARIIAGVHLVALVACTAWFWYVATTSHSLAGLGMLVFAVPLSFIALATLGRRR